MTTLTPTRKNRPRILRVWFEHITDGDADTSYLGEYSSKATSDYSIDREKRGDMGRGEHRYFNPSFNYVDKNDVPCEGNTPEDVVKYVEQDYEHMERLNRGDWCYIGVIAKAKVQMTGDLCQTITSGGVWGVENDSSGGEHNAEYIASVEQDELFVLRSELEAIGFSKDAIDRAFAAKRGVA